MERTLVLLKPDAVARGLVGHILTRFEAKGLRLVGLKMLRLTQALAEKHYSVHAGKPFYQGLLRFLTSGPVVAVCLEGGEAVAVARCLLGATRATEAAAGTIRGDLAMSNRFNLVHASDSADAATAEIANFFSAEELVEVPRDLLKWLYDFSEGGAL